MCAVRRLGRYLRHNLWAGLRTAPRAGWRRWLPLAGGYAVAALALALATGQVRPGLAESRLFFILPFTLLVFPVLFEEAFFRGMLIPRDLRGRGKTAVHVVVSSILFVLWHPLNAVTINPTARDTFLRPDFLVIVFLLGLACGVGYVISRSLWVPILIHWVTVVVWVLGLGGRNLILE
jgi:predicted Abi (CAAX) family protease